jgi:invasion protein IalB
MPRLLPVLSILALMAAPITAFAQDTTEQPAEETAAEPAGPTVDDQGDVGGPAAPQGGELAMGEDIRDPNAPGTPYLREVVDDWALECIRMPEGQEEPCQLFQSLTDEKGNLVSNVRIFRLPDGQRAVAGALVAVPLETLLTAQLTIRVDGGQAKRYPFAVCDPLGCYARIGFTAEDVNAFKRGAKATVSLVPFVAPDQPLNLDMSLKGFTAAFDKATVMPN